MSDNELLSAISNMIEPIREDLQGVKEDLQGVKEDLQGVKDRVKRIELNQENNIIPRLQTIEMCYTSTYDRYRVSVEDYETMKQDISVLKSVVTNHSKQIQMLSQGINT